MPVFPCGGKVLLASLVAEKWHGGGVFLVGALWSAPEWVLGQQVLEPAPTVEWHDWNAPEDRPAGVWYTYVTGTNAPAQWTAANLPQGTQTKDQSGIDWFYAVKVIYENDVPVGSIACGYTTFANFLFGTTDTQGDCVYGDATGQPDPSHLLTYERWSGGSIFGTVARFDMEGNVQWYQTYLPGQLYGLVIDGEGKIVVTGRNSTNRVPSNLDPATVVRYNPQSGTQPLTVSGCGYGQDKLIVMKIDPVDGSIIWSNLYGPDATFTEAASRVGIGWDVEPTYDQQQALDGYRVVGMVQGATGHRPIVLDITQEGYLNWQHVYDGTDANDPAQEIYFPPADGNTWGYAIGRTPKEAGEHFAVSGFRYRAWTPDWGGKYSSWMFYMDDSTDPALPHKPDWYKDVSIDNEQFTEHELTLNQNSTDICFVMDNGQPLIIWPVLANFNGSIFPGNHEASAFIYRIDPELPGTVTLLRDLGPGFRGFDLQLSVCPLSDGNIAVASTRWSPPHSANDWWGFDDLTPEAQTCLQNNYSYDPDPGDLAGIEPIDWDAAPPANNDIFSYWGTDSYCTKLDPNTGDQFWQYQWDDGDGPGVAPGAGPVSVCFPDNIRQRQCNFKICDSGDGGILISGNTGHAFDDAYLAKLSPCDPRASYAPYTLDPNGEYHITANTTWNTTMNVKGSFVIDPGFTLTIDGATIGFADSRQFTFPTNVKVMPGATLLMRNNAHLTSVSGCPTSMWDGVKVLSDGTGTGAGSVIVESGGKVSNAFTGILASDGDPVNPSVDDGSGGGNITLTDAVFENNKWDVYRAPHTFDVGAMQTYTRCTFRTNAALNYSTLNPKAHVVAQDAGPMTLWGCSFENTAQSDPANALTWGMGFFAFHTTAVIERDPVSLTVPAFTGLYLAVRHHTWTAGRMIKLDEGVFNGCGLSIYLTGSSNSVITRNTVNVPDHPVTGLQYNYGSSLYACTGFEFEENVFTATGSDWPKAGSIFSKTGIENNLFYNNCYNGFTGNGTAGYSAGTVIQKENHGADEFGGLHFKCNDYSSTTANDYDIAFTDEATIGQQQGGDADNKAPGGNTFEPLCLGGSSEQNLYVEFGLNQFDYYHHDPASTPLRVVPECASAVIDQAAQYMPTVHQYDKPLVCPVDLSGGMVATADVGSAAAAEAEFTLLREVYDDWADGGNTAGLLDYIRDAHNSSYDVRNHLMLVAPRVTLRAWEETINRVPAMNPWHVAQALIANSPLQAEVLALVESSGLTDYHKTLINNAQGGGISMLSLMESDMARAYGNKANALRDYTSKALLGRQGATLSGALQLHTDHPKRTSAVDRLGLALAMGDLHLARTEVDAGLLDRDLEDYFIVQDLYVNLLEHYQKATDLDAGGVGTLQQLATTDGSGAGAAQAWLMMLGEEWPEEVVLPRPVRSAQAKERASAVMEPLLTAYPNPSNGPVYLVAQLPEGADQAVIRVVDPVGRIILENQFSGRVGMFEIPEKDLAAGVYTAGLFIDGINAGNTKFEVLR